jgi:hypothetical protein
MPAKNARSESGGFSAGERAAMKERAAELRAEGKAGRQEGRRPAGGPRQHRADGTGGSRASRARACDGDRDRPRASGESGAAPSSRARSAAEHCRTEYLTPEIVPDASRASS